MPGPNRNPLWRKIETNRESSLRGEERAEGATSIMRVLSDDVESEILQRAPYTTRSDIYYFSLFNNKINSFTGTPLALGPSEGPLVHHPPGART